MPVRVLTVEKFFYNYEEKNILYKIYNKKVIYLWRVLTRKE